MQRYKIMSIESIKPLEELVGVQQLLESRWKKLHDENPDGVFRYQLAIERERVTEGRCRFLLQVGCSLQRARELRSLHASVKHFKLTYVWRRLVFRSRFFS